MAFYRFWHGCLHLKGAGLLLRLCSPFLPELDHYSLHVPGIGCLTVNMKDASGMAWMNYSLGEKGHEDGVISVLKKLAPNNPVVWDIGANAGFFAAALAERMDGYSEIRLFEPNPTLISCLHELADCLPNIHVHNLAFSDTPGNLTLHIPNGNSTTTSQNPVPNSMPILVECTTGDVFLKDFSARDPDVVVIDTEGNDCRVINGLSGLVKRKRPVIFFEHIFLSEETIRSTMPEGYEHFTVDDRSGELVRGVDLIRGHNSVFVPKQ
jgi:FkbM family methyltransferase